ncbi:TetR family transcriptional regulator C-terminal domain-containing protein [Nocardioides panaciterrulae]|uniref:AcrR family transcriptional regulator n=1 Tax=Nocardioides panaciterrulae TaxID=661492 RepID=A0A7Y9E370_9ACTN|nr:TetR family transcriptional regulator C-terminal domain-containing protein [Nocardioides panaciterrulae]NYD40167.1 AcrR family transcriptional regulator [Nocardioides panaciterrulae]
MPRKIDYADRGDLIVDSVCRIVLRGGLPALSLRAVAGEIGMSPSSLLHQFDNRARLLSVSAAKVGAARTRYATWACHQRGPVGLLPRRPDDLDRARVWLAFVELARSEQDVAEVVAHIRDEERQILMRTTLLDAGAPELVALAALIDGLLSGMTAGRDPLPLECAERALALHLHHTGLALERQARVVDERSTTTDPPPGDGPGDGAPPPVGPARVR